MRSHQRWLTSYMNTFYFYKSFLKKVRSHLGESAHVTGSAHLHMNSLYVSLFHESSCSRVFLNGYYICFTRALATIHCLYTTYLIDISISDVVFMNYFRGTLTAILFEKYRHYFRKPLVFFRLLCFFEQALAVFPSSLQLFCHTSCSHPFLERPLFYYKIAVAAMHALLQIYCVFSDGL